MSVSLVERPRRFIDIETTGLDPEQDEILEIAILDERGRVLLNTRIKPEHIETAHPKALEVNGYTEGGWEDAPPWLDVAVEVAEHLRGAVIFGHGVRFDYGFIMAHLKKAAVGTDAIGFILIDTMTLAWDHLVPVGLRWLTLGAICNMLGISNTGEHTALADTERCRRVYHKLHGATWLRKLWWGFAWFAWRKQKARKKR